MITSLSHLFYHQPGVFNVSELENVPNFLDTFDCKDGEVFSVNFVELQGKANISLYVVLSQIFYDSLRKQHNGKAVILSVACTNSMNTIELQVHPRCLKYFQETQRCISKLFEGRPNYFKEHHRFPRLLLNVMEILDNYLENVLKILLKLMNNSSNLNKGNYDRD